MSIKLIRVSLLIAPQLCIASGFQIFEVGTPSTATAGVGQAAYANDASTAFLNPAGMALLDQNQLLIGSQLYIPNTQFSRNLNNTIPGGNGEKNNMLMPGAGIYYVSKINSRLSAGVSFNSPYGGVVDYGNQWSGRYLVEDATLITVNLNPAMSYQINDTVAVGGGFSIQYATLDESLAIPLPGLLDGEARLKVNDYALGFNLGLLFTPTTHSRLGIAYRSQINQKLTGQAYFNRLNATPDTSVQLITPNTIIASYYQDINENFSLVAETGWANWSKFVNTVVQIKGFTDTIPRNWKDAYRVGLGGKYKINPKIDIMTGISYDGSPNKLSTRLPDFPLDRQVRYAAGVLYKNKSKTQFGFQYEYVDFGNAQFNQATNQGVFAGSLKNNYGHFISLTMNADV